MPKKSGKSCEKRSGLTVNVVARSPDPATPIDQSFQLSDRFHDLRQHLGLGPQGLFGQEGQWRLDRLQSGQEVGPLGVEIEQAGEELALLVAFFEERQGRGAGS